MRRIHPNFIMRLRSGLPAAAKTFIVLCGLAGTLITILAATKRSVLEAGIIVLIGLPCLIISVIVMIVKGHLKHLPDQMILDDSVDGHCSATFCSAQSLREANALTRPYYRHEYVSDEVAEMWRQKNPKGFVNILDSNGELCASFGILALESSFMSQFIKGRVIDNFLLGDDILNATESRRSNNLYISGVVVRDPESFVGRRRACIMVWSMIVYLQKYYGLRKRRTIYALAVSRTSENILQKCGFRISSPASQRADKINLYELEITKDNLHNILLRVGDFSQLCNCNYD